MSADLRQCSREFLAEFIELYKSFPCLWQIKNKEYSDRNKKNSAYEELINKYKEVDAGANKETISKKINSLRSVYKKELAKVKKSETSGTAEEDVYKPSLWYFHLLDFLNDQDIPRTPRETIDNDAETASVAMEEGNAESDLNFDEVAPSPSPENSGYQTPSSVSTNRSRGSSRKRQARTNDNELLQVLSKAEKRLESATCDDSFDRYGKHIADRLRQINPNQHKFVQKLISDILFEADMENLNKNFKVIDIGQTQVQSRTSMPPRDERTHVAPGTYYHNLQLLSQPTQFTSQVMSQPGIHTQQSQTQQYVGEPTEVTYEPSVHSTQRSEIRLVDMEPSQSIAKYINELKDMT